VSPAVRRRRLPSGRSIGYPTKENKHGPGRIAKRHEALPQGRRNDHAAQQRVAGFGGWRVFVADGRERHRQVDASIDRPDSGTITVNGTEITSLSRSRLANWRAAHVGYIFQTHNLIPVLTAYENVELPLLLLPMSRTERRQRVELALEAVDLADRAEHFPRQLSGGQEQRVGVARAIVTHPTIVVADEPTGNLDDDTSQQILRLLERLNDELGVTMLMVTHDADSAAIAGRQFRLEHGHLLEVPSAVRRSVASRGA
jgi:putative ABC transport system ATP-binding protein